LKAEGKERRGKGEVREEGLKRKQGVGVLRKKTCYFGG
jgi:hypothetical protein